VATGPACVKLGGCGGPHGDYLDRVVAVLRKDVPRRRLWCGAEDL